ncbi:MAG: formate dehydrogenase subunit gamma [Proteobacteria bacterium]|nr:MAG: formate dehydrogenase subunit gamma [Pseudomonadota bacterium]
MKRTLLFLFTLFAMGAFAGEILQEHNSAIFGKDLLTSILQYDKSGSLHLGHWFTILQGQFFTKIFLGIAIGVPLAFLLHYLIIGPMVFAHDRKKIYVFNLFHRIVHWWAGISFVVIVPTGFVMVFGASIGGGEFVRICKELHFAATFVFAIAVLPMFFMWVKDMFIAFVDIKWLLIVGGYLSKKKKPVPAGKFNAGQKTWFWAATLGGIIMIITGLSMSFQDFHIPFLQDLGISQIDYLRGSAIVHNVLGMYVAALFFVHLYMSIFAIKGAIHSMITGYKEEEEVEILHSTFYKQLKEKKVV